MANYFYDKLPDDIQYYIYMINKTPEIVKKYICRNYKIINIKKHILPFLHNNNNLILNFNSFGGYDDSIKYIYNYEFIQAFIDSYYYDYKFNDLIFWHKLLSVIFKLTFHSEFTNFSHTIIQYKKKSRLLNKYTLLFCKKYNFKLYLCVRNNSRINYSIHEVYSNNSFINKPINFYKLLSYIKIFKPYKKKIYDENQIWN